MKFFWDFKTKRLGKIEHTLSRDYFLSNFKSDFLSIWTIFITIIPLSHWSKNGHVFEGTSVHPKWSEGFKIYQDKKWPDFDPWLLWTRDSRLAWSDYVRDLKILLGSGPAWSKNLKNGPIFLIFWDQDLTARSGTNSYLSWKLIYESVYTTHRGHRFESRIDLPLSVSRRVGYFLVVLESVRLNSRDNTWDFDTWWFMLQGWQKVWHQNSNW